ncbi:hypothetical protein [Pseudomonas reactans]
MIKQKSGPTDSQPSADWAGDTFRGSASGDTGELQMRWRRSGSTLEINVLRYMISGDGSHKSGNINIIVHAHYGKEWKLNKNNCIQDGAFKDWDAYGALDLGSAGRITVKVVIVFDQPGIDDRTTITKEFNV